MSKEDYRPSGIPTLDASEHTYQFEKARIKGIGDDEIDRRYSEMEEKVLPDNLKYVDDIYDRNTGTSATAFRNTDTGKIIIAYTGTNPDSDGINDILKSDINSIAFGQGTHYQPAFDFYEKIQQQYGAENIILTGHSLGGNVAQRVALRYNAPQTVVYNAAPLYVPITSFARVSSNTLTNNPLDLAVPQIALNIATITAEQRMFTGKVTRITTAKDPLNNVSDFAGAVYLGDEFVIPHSGSHFIKDLREVSSIIKPIESAAISATTIVTDTQSKMNSLQQKRAELKVNEIGKGSPNGLSSAEMIYLDAEQAKTLSEGLGKAVEAGIGLLEGKAQIAIEAAKDVYDTLDDPLFLSILSPYEVEAAYAEAGVDYTTTLDKVEEHCQEKIEKAKSIAQAFNDLHSQIQTGVETLAQKDTELAGLIANG